MKAFLFGLAAAIIVAAGAAYVLDTEVQQTAESYHTEAVRL